MQSKTRGGIRRQSGTIAACHRVRLDPEYKYYRARIAAQMQS